MAVKAMKIHPLCRMFGAQAPMPPKEMDDLIEDIKQNGIKVPILVNKKRDTILDGATRWRIAYDLKLDIPKKEFEVFQGKDDEIEGEILSRNLFRRHMTPKERSEIVSKILGPKLEKEAKERQSAAGSFKKKQDGADAGATVAHLAKKAGVSVHTQKQSEKLRKADLLDDVIAKKKTRAAALKQAGTKRRKPSKPKVVPPFEDVVYKKWCTWINKFGSQKRRVMELVKGWIGSGKSNGNGKK